MYLSEFRLTRINGFFKYPDLNQVGGLTATIQILRKTRNNKIKGALTTRMMEAVGKKPLLVGKPQTAVSS